MHLRTTAPGDPMWTSRGMPAGEPPTPASAVGVAVEAGEHHIWLATADMDGGFDAVSAAMLVGDAKELLRLDPELVPLYCRECATSYCEGHWETWSVFDDEWPSWFDELRGRCPAGHERRIYD